MSRDHSQTRCALLLAVLVACLVPNTPALAQTRNWEGDADQCYLGNFLACIDVHLTMMQLPEDPISPTGGTMVSLEVRNLQQLAGLGGPWAIPGWFTLSNVTFSTTRHEDFGTHANVSFTGSAERFGDGLFGGGAWLHSGEAGSPTGSITRQAQLDDGAYVIAGCQPLTPYMSLQNRPYYGGEANNYFRTCNGSVIFNFFSYNWAFTDQTSLTIFGNQGFGAPAERYELGLCTSGTSCPVTATPEPATLLLLVTGLAGVAGIHLRRRRLKA